MAIATLQGAGWTKNSDNKWEKFIAGSGQTETLEFDLKYSSANPIDFVIANLVKEDLAKAGILVKIVPTEPTTFVYDFGRYVWNYDMMITVYTETGDPTYFNFYVTTNSLINLNGISLPEVDSIYYQQQLKADYADRKALIDELQQVLYEDSSIIPLVNFQDIELYRNDRWQFRAEDANVQSGLFSLYNTYAFLYADIPSQVTNPVSSSSQSSSSSGAGAPGFTILALVSSFLVSATFLKYRRKRY